MVVALSCTTYAFAEEIDGEEVIEQETEVVETEQPVEDDADAWFSTIWNRVKEWAIAFGSGISIAGIGSAIAYAVIKSTTSKTMNKITTNYNAETIADKTSAKMVEKWGNTAFEVDMKPLMEYQYRQMSAQINIDINKQNELFRDMMLAQLDTLETLGSYFDCSVAVSDERKEAFHNAIEKQRELFNTPKNQVQAKVEIVAEAPKTEKKSKVVENY